MHDTATAIVTNLISLIEQYGFVLNGARSYYTNRRYSLHYSNFIIINWILLIVLDRVIINLSFLVGFFYLLLYLDEYSLDLYTVHGFVAWMKTLSMSY